MTTDDILRMAREAGFQDRDGTIRTMHSSGAWVGINEELERFAALVAAAERDECAQVAEWTPSLMDTPQKIAAAIRARGTK